MAAIDSAIAAQILLVEDDHAISNAVHTLLQHYGFNVTIARTLAEGRRFMTQTPEMVILDLMLPDGDGLDLLERMRATNSKTRVIVLTGSVDPDHERRIKRLKPARYFRKPLNFFNLLEGIRAEVELMAAEKSQAQPMVI